MFALLLLVVCPSFAARTFWAGSSPIFTELMLEEGWERAPTPAEAQLIWTRRATRIDEPSLDVSKDAHWLNRITASDTLTDKGHLHGLLTSAGLQNFAPQTFDLSNRDEHDAFWTEDRSDSVWVSKEPHLSRGVGIVIDEDLERLRARGSDRVLVQRYVDNPFLVDNRKMEIRIYWMLASVHAPYLVLFYPNATVRLAAEDYVHGRTDNRLAHVLNTHQQKLAGKYEGRKLSLPQLAQYAEDTQLVPNGDVWLEERLFPSITYMLGKIVDAARPLLMQKRLRPVNDEWDGRFELFGADILLNESLFPTLIEIQRGPGLSMDSAIKRETIPHLISDTVRVVEALGAGESRSAAQATNFRVVRSV